MPHGALAGLADDGEGLGQDGVEGCLFRGESAFVGVGIGRVDLLGGDGFCDALAELGGLGTELLVGERLRGGLESINLSDKRQNALYSAFVTCAEDFGDN